MKQTGIAIIGGGLSGLYAAYLLQQHGITDYRVLEARDTLGGRITSAATTSLASQQPPEGIDLSAFDLGPTWYWPLLQPALARLIEQLGLSGMAQFEHGNMMIERAANMPAQALPGYPAASTSMRIAGGMDKLITALYQQLRPSQILTGHRVCHLHATPSAVILDVQHSTGGQQTQWQASHVLLALPPRLAEHQLTLTPPLPVSLARQWRNTPTWMAPHAKYLAVYKTPFWRQQGLSGQGRSAIGPMVEIHDASTEDGDGALFGFIGIPAHVRKNHSDEVLISHCRAQLGRLFGEQAQSPLFDCLQDWAQQPFTATERDVGASEHHDAPPSVATSGDWAGRVTGIGSEWSQQFPGYLAGAIDAAEQGVSPLLEQLSQN